MNKSLIYSTKTKKKKLEEVNKDIKYSTNNNILNNEKKYFSNCNKINYICINPEIYDTAFIYNNNSNIINILNKKYLFIIYYLNFKYINEINLENKNNYFKNQIENLKNLKNLKNEKCIICLNNIKNIIILNCGHIFCYNCIINSFIFKKECPICRENLQSKKNFLIKNKNHINNIKLLFGNKILKLLQIIKKYPNNNITIFTLITHIVLPLKILIKNLFQKKIKIINNISKLTKNFDFLIFLEKINFKYIKNINANKIYLIIYNKIEPDIIIN